jgi:hypothetical protein
MIGSTKFFGGRSEITHTGKGISEFQFCWKKSVADAMLACSRRIIGSTTTTVITDNSVVRLKPCENLLQPTYPNPDSSSQQ